MAIKSAARASICMITNIINGKKYIGVTTKNPLIRFDQHLRLAHYKPETLLHKALCKYPYEAFYFQVVATVLDEKFKEELEIILIAQENTKVPHGYNLTNGGEGLKGLTEETREKMRKAQRTMDPKLRKKINDSHKGRKFAPWAIQQKSTQMKEMWAKPATRERLIRSFKEKTFSPEHRRRLSLANTGKKLSPEHCAAISASKKGTKLTPEQLAKVRKIFVDPERNAKISNKLKGRKYTTEQRVNHQQAMSSLHTKNKISKALKGRKMSPEHLRNMTLAVRAYHAKRKENEQRA